MTWILTQWMKRVESHVTHSLQKEENHIVNCKFTFLAIFIKSSRSISLSFPRGHLGFYVIALLVFLVLLFLFGVDILIEVKGFPHWLPIISWDDSNCSWFSLYKKAAKNRKLNLSSSIIQNAKTHSLIIPLCGFAYDYAMFPIKQRV